MSIVRSIILVPAVLASAAAAQSSDTIDVTGRKLEEVRKEAKSFVRATGVAEGEKPVARWVDPVCPRAVGVSEAVAAKVERRIREIARNARIRLAHKPCNANLTIAFTDDAGAVTREVADRSQAAFDNVAAADRKALYGDAAPIRWWHTVELRTSDGMRSMGDVPPPSAQLDGIGSMAFGGQVLQQYRPSFLRTQVVRALTSSSVVIDVGLAEGKTLDSVADYAAFVGLAEIGPSDPPPETSILSLFEQGGRSGLTALDQTFLRALYRLPLDRTALAQRGLLVRGLLNPADGGDN